MREAADDSTYTRDVVLRDGQTIHLRPIRPEDFEKMMALWGRLSPETVRLRFFGPRHMDDALMRYLVEVDRRSRFAMVAEQGGRIVGVGRFERLNEDPTTADFAVTVEDAEQGRGIGTVLLRSLMAPARDLGISRFHGDILGENRNMLRVLTDAGFEPVFRSYGDVVSATFTTTPSEAFLERAGEDDRKAAIAALTGVFTPSSVAVVGASRNPRSIGGILLANLLRGGFAGPVYPVNPHAAHVHSVAAYAHIGDCPTVPDLTLVCVPAPQVPQVLEEAGAAGVRSAVVVSSGFAEAGPAGAELEHEILAIARSHGMRLIGPNCMGVLNTSAAVQLNASLSPVVPPAGRIGFSSQSGALGVAILNAAARIGLGLSSFASVGNKADLSGNDLLQYWESDPTTDVILLYLESFGNPRTFARIARRVGRRKPIVAVKSGRSAAGEAAVSRHTGARAATEDAAQALFEQVGVLRVDTMREMFDVAGLLANQPLPQGSGLAVLTTGGGPGILAADAASQHGLALARLESATLERLRAALPAAVSHRNPVDLHPTARAAEYAAALPILAADPGVDAIIAIFIPPVPGDDDSVAAALAEALPMREVTLAAVFMTSDRPPAALQEAGIPSFTFPESAAAALGQVARYAAWRRRHLGNVVEVRDADTDTARAVVQQAQQRAGEDGADVTLSAPETDRLLAAFGVPMATSVVVNSARDAAAAAARLGGPVAVKSAAAIDKTTHGLVRLGLSRPRQVSDAVTAMRRDLLSREDETSLAAGWIVQQMIPDGVEMVVWVSYDVSFGPVLHAALGGPQAELMGDVSRRILPLTDVDAADMLASLRGYPLLTGYRGSESVDVNGLRALLLRLNALVEVVPEVRELRLNPIFVRRHGVTAVDALVRLAAP